MSRLRKINVYLNRSKTISLYRTDDEIQFLKQFAKEKFGKANVSLAIRYLLLEELKKSEQQPESVECTNQDNHVEKQKFHRFSVTFRGKHSAYLRQKAKSARKILINGLNFYIHTSEWLIHCLKIMGLKSNHLTNPPPQGNNHAVAFNSATSRRKLTN